jgi:hypothetical protein
MKGQQPHRPWTWYEWLGLALFLAAGLGLVCSGGVILLFRLL